MGTRRAEMLMSLTVRNDQTPQVVSVADYDDYEEKNERRWKNQDRRNAARSKNRDRLSFDE